MTSPIKYMISFHRYCSLPVALALLVLLSVDRVRMVAAEVDLKRIAIVRDGASEFFNAVVNGFEAELTELASGQYEFTLVDDFNAQSNPEGMKTQLNRALTDPKIDIVYTAGIVVSALAQALPDAMRTKPVLAGAVEFSNFDNKGVSSKGTSTIPNFTFVLEPRRIPSDVAALAQMSGESTIHTFIDETIILAMAKDIEPHVQSLAKSLGLNIKVIPARGTAESCMEVLPKDAQAVYVPMMPSFLYSERVKLFNLLADRKIMAFSMMGVDDVDNGAFAGLSSDNSKALFRRMALNVHQTLSGIQTSLLPVVLRSNDQLRINMKTARRIDWSPTFDILLSAELVGMEELQKSDGELTLDQAMAMANEMNADIRLARARLQASYWETRSLRTARFPQISINGQAIRQGLSDRINQLADANTSSLSFGAELNQLLYSDRLTSQIRAQREIEDATALDLESIRLDSIENAGLLFLDCLLTDALFQIEKENLKLTLQNLNLAQMRSDIGAAEASEVFRWQASLAQGRTQLIRSDSDRKNARIALNVTIGQPRTKNWTLKTIALADNDDYFMGNVLKATVTDLSKYERYRHFVQAQAIERSPELKAFEKNLKAQGILLSERGRRNFRPEVSLSSNLRRLTAKTLGNFDSQNEWTVGIGFTIPLFEGNLRKTEKGRLNAVIDQLMAQRDKALYFVEQRALVGVYNSSASHAALRLSREAYAAANKNYDSIQSKYSLGAATILDLLDAQSQLVTQKKNQVGALNQFLKDIISIQRSIAWFEFSKTDEEKATWTQALKKSLLNE